MVRIPVFHEGTFEGLVLAAVQGLECLRHGERLWEPLEVGRRFAIYRQAPDWLGWMQQRVEDYELFFYSRLLHGHCGTDGVLRPRTHLRKAMGGAYRRSGEAEGGPA